MTIATRQLFILSDEGRIPVAVTLHAPVARPTSDWSCAYAIGWPDKPRHGTAYGIDAVQALELCLQSIGSELYGSPEHAAGRLVWEGAGGGYGFPVTPGLGDRLEGYDRRFGGA